MNVSHEKTNSENEVNVENEVNEVNVENEVNEENEENKQMILDDVLSRLSELLKDNRMEQLVNMDTKNIENDMNEMVEKLKKKNDPNIMSMLNLFNNLSISNLTDSNFSLGDCDISNLGRTDTFSDTSEDDEDDEENYDPNNYDNSSTDTDEDLLNYMKDREENEDMVLSIKQRLEEVD
jgi:hypothetical protein